ncbi:actin-related protein 2/3 complex, subunit 1 [Cryptosporidium felis]|nr:actin-related protein 2/3 complex, subunit 1 [Cryptosporidium felis]
MKLVLEKQLETKIAGANVSLICNNRSIRIFQLENLLPGGPLAELVKHRNHIVHLDWSLLPEGYPGDSSYSQLVSVGEDRLVVVWLLKEKITEGLEAQFEVIASLVDCIRPEGYPMTCRLSANKDFCCFAVSTTSGDIHFFSSKKRPPTDKENEDHNDLKRLYSFDQLRIGLSELPLTCLKWSSDGRFLISGGLEKRGVILKIFDNCEKSDPPGASRGPNENLDSNSPEPLPVVQVLSSIETQDAIVACDISPKSGHFAFADKDSNIYFSQVNRKLELLNSSLHWNGLPFFSIKFAHEKLIAAVGHDCIPVLFIQDSNSMWMHAKKLNGAIMPSYLDPAWLAGFDPMKHYTQTSAHKRPIMDVFISSSGHFVTCGFDGKCCVWELESGGG